jgi:hypothetical protein
MGNDWLAQNRDSVSEWRDMSNFTAGLFKSESQENMADYIYIVFKQP